MSRAKHAELNLEQPAQLDDGALERRLYGLPAAQANRSNLPAPEYIERELRRPGVTLELLHVEYLREHPDGVRYTTFCNHYREWRKRQSPRMPQTHRAGEKLFVDYSGPRPRSRHTHRPLARSALSWSVNCKGEHERIPVRVLRARACGVSVGDRASASCVFTRDVGLCRCAHISAGSGCFARKMAHQVPRAQTSVPFSGSIFSTNLLHGRRCVRRLEAGRPQRSKLRVRASSSQRIAPSG